jgi:hypothetical protein
MWTALISALVALLGSAGAIILTKRQERSAIWRAKKLAYYEEFLASASGIVGHAPPEAKIRFATAVNNLHLIGSAGVIRALHAFTDEIAESNAVRFSKERHDDLWSHLVWEIRADLNDPPTRDPSMFRARLWASGVGKNILP